MVTYTQNSVTLKYQLSNLPCDVLNRTTQDIIYPIPKFTIIVPGKILVQTIRLRTGAVAKKSLRPHHFKVIIATGNTMKQALKTTQEASQRVLLASPEVAAIPLFLKTLFGLSQGFLADGAILLSQGLNGVKASPWVAGGKMSGTGRTNLFFKAIQNILNRKSLE